MSEPVEQKRKKEAVIEDSILLIGTFGPVNTHGENAFMRSWVTV